MSSLEPPDGARALCPVRPNDALNEVEEGGAAECGEENDEEEEVFVTHLAATALLPHTDAGPRFQATTLMEDPWAALRW